MFLIYEEIILATRLSKNQNSEHILLKQLPNSSCTRKLSISEAYLEPSRISKMERFAKIGIKRHSKALTLFEKRSFSDVWLGSKYDFACNSLILLFYISYFTKIPTRTYLLCFFKNKLFSDGPYLGRDILRPLQSI